jgi:hypothetical protein
MTSDIEKQVLKGATAYRKAKKLLRRIQYHKRVQLSVFTDNGTCYLQAIMPNLKVIGAKPGVPRNELRGRWWVVTDDPFNPNAFIQTAFKAICDVEDHERRERFRYKGVRVFDPHREF